MGRGNNEFMENRRTEYLNKYMFTIKVCGFRSHIQKICTTRNILWILMRLLTKGVGSSTFYF